MSDEFFIAPYQVRAAGTDVPPEEVQKAINSLAQQTTADLNLLAGQVPVLPVPSGSVTYNEGGTGAVTRTLTSKLQESISILDFGADPTGSADSTTAFANWINAVLAGSRSGYAPGGTYKISSQFVLTLPSPPAKGIKLYGDGQFATIFDFSTVSASPVFSVQGGGANNAAFYSSFRDFGIRGNVAGVLLQVGDINFTAALNSFEFGNLWVGNSSASASTVAVQCNYVLDTLFENVIAANNAHGDGWQLNAAAFCTWINGAGTFSDNGVHLTAGGPGTGTIAGNVFIGMDLEANSVTNVKIDTANAHNNTWIGGTQVYNPGTTFAVTASAGSDNSVVSPNTLGFPSGTPSLANFFNGSTGVGLIQKFSQSTFLGQVTSPIFNVSAAAGVSRPVFYQTNGSNRWAHYANSTAESGGNAGSDFNLSRYSDAGSFIDSPFVITRSTGLVTVSDGLLVSGASTISASNGNLVVNDTSSTNKAFVQFQKNGTAEWNVGNASSSNSFGIDRFVAGSFVDTPIGISNATGTVTFSDAIAPATVKGIIGTATNDNAQAGSVGEYITATSGTITLSTGVSINITSISLTAGDWDVGGSIQFGVSAGAYSGIGGGISTTTGTLPASVFLQFLLQTAFASGLNQSQPCPQQRILLSTTTTVFLVANGSFTGTGQAIGMIWARRRR